MDWLFGIIDSVNAYLSNAVAFLASIVGWLLSAVVFLANSILALGTFIKNALVAIGNFLQNLWDNVIKKGISGLLSWLKRKGQWLELKLKPTIDYLKQLRTWYDRYYRLHILPIINMIQRIRRFLLILRLLHIHIADKLDKYLTTFERDLNRIFLTIHGALNQIIDWLNLASNPTSLGRLVLVSIATRRTIGAITRAATGLPIGHFLPSTSAKAFAFERRPQRAADYLSETTNPTAAQILRPLLSLAPPSPPECDIAVTDAELDAVEPTPWGQEYINGLIASEKARDGLTYNGLSLWQSIEVGAGDLNNASNAAANVTQSGPDYA